MVGGFCGENLGFKGDAARFYDFAEGVYAGGEGAVIFEEWQRCGVDEGEVCFEESVGEFYGGLLAEFKEGVVGGFCGHFVDFLLPVLWCEFGRECFEVFFFHGVRLGFEGDADGVAGVCGDVLAHGVDAGEGGDVLDGGEACGDALVAGEGDEHDAGGGCGGGGEV